MISKTKIISLTLILILILVSVYIFSHQQNDVRNYKQQIISYEKNKHNNIITNKNIKIEKISIIKGKYCIPLLEQYYDMHNLIKINKKDTTEIEKNILIIIDNIKNNYDSILYFKVNAIFNNKTNKTYIFLSNKKTIISVL